MKTLNKLLLTLLVCMAFNGKALAWPGMPMPELHVEGRYLKTADGTAVTLHGFGQTYSPWFNEQNSKWGNYDVNACLNYNKEKIDQLLAAGWKMSWLRLHMDPYWSNTPGKPTTGENDISAFDFNRFRTYLHSVFIPMAEYAISKGLYVVMRPPGVCPEEIAVGDAYHSYLKRVWGYISTQEKLTGNPHIMFELANEPVRIKDTDGQYRANTDGCNKNLTRFFQEIVDLMRNNGCQNILWIPGTGYQSQYAGFAKYPIQGQNIGYAVHVYPGWYGSDAIEPSHELGGSYGGGFEAFSAGWKAQVEPAAAIAPILVTEMDWAPSKYNASWGKSITGRMLAEGFGANFKYLADRTGNVSWMIFTGAEHLAKFDGKPGTPGNYTLYNDPDACLWPTYHWYKEYAGDQMPAPAKAELCMSPRKGGIDQEHVMLTGSSKTPALIATYDGYESNLDADFNVEIHNPDILTWADGRFTAIGQGKATATVAYTAGAVSGTQDLSFNATLFPLVSGCFDPSIWETGSFDDNTNTVITGQWGFAGWKYPAGIDLSAYNYLIAELDSPNECGVSFRVFDLNNYWSDPAQADFGTSRRVAIALNNMKSINGRSMDKSHIYIVGFWSTGGKPFRIKNVFAAMSPDESGIEETVCDTDTPASVDVYDLQGRKVRSCVPAAEATEGLAPGIYIAGGKKIYVRP